MDFAGFPPCTSPKTYNNLADGEHIFEVRAVGANGLRRRDARDPRVDRRGAARDADHVRAGRHDRGTTASFSFTANELGATFECSLDGAAFSECLNAAPDHRAHGRAAHAPRPCSRHRGQRRLDAGRLHLERRPDSAADHDARTSRSGVDRASASRPASPGSSFECKVDAGSFEPCTSPRTYPNARRRLAQLPGARDRRGRQRRPDAGQPRLDRRHDGAADHDRLGRARRRPRRARARASASPAASRARPSSARSTVPPTPRARRRRTTPAWRSASTSSASARWTRAGNVDSTRPRPTPGRSRRRTAARRLQPRPTPTAGSTSASTAQNKGSRLGPQGHVEGAEPQRPRPRPVRDAEPARGLRGEDRQAAPLLRAPTRTGARSRRMRVTGSWTEGGVTWDNQPATTGTPATAPSPQARATASGTSGGRCRPCTAAAPTTAS